MGLTFVPGKVTGPTGASRTVGFHVDSGATYSLLPHDIWQELGLEATESFHRIGRWHENHTRRL